MRQQTRPIIGINADFVAAEKHTAAELRLHPGYADSILNAGGMPVIMPPINREPEINAFLERVDGFLLSGGRDLDPRKRGEPWHAAVRPMAERRASHDSMLVASLLKRRLPLLAVGVGMQQLNIAFEGTLYMHLPEELPRAMPHRDRDEEGPHRHLVLLQKNTQLEEIYGGEELLVNSEHHQAVRRVGEGMHIGAKAPDGVIEAIETDDPDWFCIGVQWHPESDDASALDMQLFECFIQACIRQSEPLQLAA